jgi:hypothetical protein
MVVLGELPALVLAPSLLRCLDWVGSSLLEGMQRCANQRAGRAGNLSAHKT